MQIVSSRYHSQEQNILSLVNMFIGLISRPYQRNLGNWCQTKGELRFSLVSSPEPPTDIHTLFESLDHILQLKKMQCVFSDGGRIARKKKAKYSRSPLPSTACQVSWCRLFAIEFSQLINLFFLQNQNQRLHEN